MSQRRNPSCTVNGSNRNPDVSDRQPRTSAPRDSNKSILSERLTLAVSSSLSYVESDVKKEHEKEEPINNEDVDIQLIKLQRKK